MQYKQETIIEELHKGVCTVQFTKVDGTQRTMHCTLNPSYAPTMPQQLQEAPNSVPNPDSMAVWDTDADAWRSFRIDSILEFNSPTLLKG